MEDVKLDLDEQNKGAFFILEGKERLGEMTVAISDSSLTVHHTGVAQKAEGKGYAKKLLQEMVAYARKHQLQVVPLCAFVHTQFKRHPNDFADVWNEEADKRTVR